MSFAFFRGAVFCVFKWREHISSINSHTDEWKFNNTRKQSKKIHRNNLFLLFELIARVFELCKVNWLHLKFMWCWSACQCFPLSLVYVCFVREKPNNSILNGAELSWTPHIEPRSAHKIVQNNRKHKETSNQIQSNEIECSSHLHTIRYAQMICIANEWNRSNYSLCFFSLRISFFTPIAVENVVSIYYKILCIVIDPLKLIVPENAANIINLKTQIVTVTINLSLHHFVQIQPTTFDVASIYPSHSKWDVKWSIIFYLNWMGHILNQHSSTCMCVCAMLYTIPYGMVHIHAYLQSVLLNKKTREKQICAEIMIFSEGYITWLVIHSTLYVNFTVKQVAKSFTNVVASLKRKKKTSYHIKSVHCNTSCTQRTVISHTLYVTYIDWKRMGMRFAQEMPSLPLAHLKFERFTPSSMSFANWKNAH